MNFLTSIKTALGLEPQAWLFDSTFYCRLKGLSAEKIKQHNFAGMLIQSGFGDTIVDTLQDQIDVAEECELPYAVWHIPDPRDGSMKFQADLIIAQPRVKGHLIVADFEEAQRGVPASLVTPAQGHDFMKALADGNGRDPWGYSNPNILKNIWKMPDWVYFYFWWIAQYPSSSWKTFEQFLQYYAWKKPSYFKDNQKFLDRIMMQQWTQWGNAQKYYAATRLPNGGPGIQNGDLDIAFVTKAQMQEILKPIEEPVPEPPDLAKRVKVLEINQDYILAAITDLVEEMDEVHNKLSEFEQRIEALEVSGTGNSKTVTVVGDKGVMFEIYDHNAAGYPILRKHEPVIRYETGETIEVAYETIRADGGTEYWLVIGGKGAGFYVRADKVK